ncbi:XRE family transcriptional regulator [Streptosporangium carneum]|uniref:XRE family transcriptional regulator n=1 Tax=Streptosporangium carneum TaxID=47481 RepID=UPI0022F2A9FB|nr:XRE family transcriptional regulator [Streptosporangium carneum]
MLGLDEDELFCDDVAGLTQRGPSTEADLVEESPTESRRLLPLPLPTSATSSYASEKMGDPLTLAWTVGRLDQRMDRRALLQLAATVTTSTVLDPAERLLRALAGDHRPDNVTVSHLESRTRGFHRLEENFPAHALYPALMTHLSEISTLLESGPSEALRKRLAVTAGESAVLAGWFAWELGDTRQAVSLSRLVGMAAKQGHDPATAAVWTGYRTYMTGGDGAYSVRLAKTALERLGEAAPATQAWLLARLAEDAALLGDRNTALNAIARAEEVYATADINDRPWTCFLDAARFASMKLAVYTRIRHEEKSFMALDGITASLGAEPEIKKLCVVKADMAIARIRVGDIKEGIDHARSSLAATDAMASPLGWDRLGQVAKELRESRTAAAREFHAEYAATRPTATPPSLL